MWFVNVTGINMDVLQARTDAVRHPTVERETTSIIIYNQPCIR